MVQTAHMPQNSHFFVLFSVDFRDYFFSLDGVGIWFAVVIFLFKIIFFLRAKSLIPTIFFPPTLQLSVAPPLIDEDLKERLMVQKNVFIEPVKNTNVRNFERKGIPHMIIQPKMQFILLCKE